MFERQDVIEREQEMTQGRENCAGSSARGPGPVLLPPRAVQSERRRERAPHRGGAGGVQGPRWGVRRTRSRKGAPGGDRRSARPSWVSSNNTRTHAVLRTRPGPRH